MGARATFYTVSDAHYFVGTVCLVNSLRLTGNDGPVVVLDAGLTASQRQRLATVATVVDRPTDDVEVAYVLKPFPALLEPHGTVVVIDGDMIVTRALDPVLDLAERGRICLVADIPAQRGRWFGEWQELFELESPPRRQEYGNAGFVALSTEHWPGFLARWWSASQRVDPARTLRPGRSSEDPFSFSDQDALNALLMSEVPEDAVVLLPHEEGPSSDPLNRVRVEDVGRLACSLDGHRPFLLHYWGGPKPWEPAAWLRVQRNGYVKLMPRVMFGSDVALRLDPTEVPRWLRPGRGPALQLRALSLANGLLRRLLDPLPYSVRRRTAQIKKLLTG